MITYEYPVDVQLGRELPTWLAGSWLPIWGGGTIVFDAAGAVRHHAEKPVTRDRVADVIRFVRRIAGTDLVQAAPAAGGHAHVDGSRTPFVATRLDDRVTIRSNPQARCGSRPDQDDRP